MTESLFGQDVLIIVSSDPRYDTRSSKFLKALTDAGHKAGLIGVCSDGEPGRDGNVVRVPITAGTGKRFFLQFYERVIPEALKSSAAVVIAGDIFALPPAIINKKRYSLRGRRVKLIYDSKELYAELPSLKRKRSSFFFWNLLEKSSIRYVDSALTVNQSISDILSKKWKIPFTVVRNVPGRTVRRDSPKSFDKIILAFSGGLQPGRGLHNLVKLMTLLPDKFELRLIGDGALRQDLADEAASLGVANRVHFTGRVRSEQVVDELSKAHLGIYLMENEGLCHYLALPNKFFQFISARLPVIVPKFPEMERLVDKYRIGAALNTEDLQETRQKVLELTGDPDLYARLRANCDVAAAELNWEVEKIRFVEAVEKLI
jgi:glycosyltransferase involved in cell wall biosynthesis